jgi:hypothetical protein
LYYNEDKIATDANYTMNIFCRQIWWVVECIHFRHKLSMLGVTLNGYNDQEKIVAPNRCPRWFFSAVAASGFKLEFFNVAQ